MGAIYFQGPVDYNATVYKLLATIEKNEAGRVIVDGIRCSKHDLVFMPMDQGKANVYGRCNAIAVAANINNSIPKGISVNTPGNPLYLGKEDNPMTPADERYDVARHGITGTGAGTGVRIYVSPNASRKSPCATGGPGSQIDEIILHEMVHALRNMQGKSQRIPTGNSRYKNEEEFLAIVVTNVYMSVKGSTQFRADHHSYKPLPPREATSSGFLADSENLKMMKIHRLTWTPTFTALSFVKSANFNPFRDPKLGEGIKPKASSCQPAGPADYSLADARYRGKI